MTTANTEQLNSEKPLTTRPPIVVVLGHVDHGKSSLLEAIRQDFNITARESSGITQHIGAYVAEYKGKTITFLDTPGHELFSAMRQRGTKGADIAVLVVAADDGVKPQTKEAIEYLKKADMPMVVALNKIDSPGANADRVKQELAEQELLVESYGGKVPAVETSATTKQGVQELLDMILLVAELEPLQADPTKPGEGTIVESRLDSRRGPTATILVANGTVGTGDYIATDSAYGKIRVLESVQGRIIEHALPSTPALVLGFLSPPAIGERFRVFADEPSAKAWAAHQRANQQKEPLTPHHAPEKTVNIVLKADVAGSLEALQEALAGMTHEQSGIRIVEAGIGEVGENDVRLALAANAYILSFRTKISAGASDLAAKQEVSIENFEVIYEVIERARALLAETAEHETAREDIGTLQVLASFLADKNRQVVGGRVHEGEMRKGLQAEIVRNGEVIGQARITGLQHDKKDVPSVQKGKECGLQLEAKDLVQEGDTLQLFLEH